MRQPLRPRIVSRIIQRLRGHYRMVTRTDLPDEVAFKNGNGGRHDDGSCWHMGWRTGYRAALALIVSGYATMTPNEVRSNREKAKRVVDRMMKERAHDNRA